MGLIEQLKATGFSFNKNLGQNFIADENYLQSVVSSLGLSKDDTVVEVGTGAGTLTRVLARNVKRVISYEVDKRLQRILEKQFEGFDNIELIFCDALKDGRDVTVDYSVVANVPYYITTPLLMKFIRDPRCKMICVLVQDDVAKRIVASPGGKEYGALSVTMQLWGDCRIIKNVPRGIFVPVPGVDSAFVIIDRHNSEEVLRSGEVDMQNQQSACVEEQQSKNLEKLLKGLFSMRRKTILNGMQQFLDKEDVIKVLNDVGIPPTFRPEQITVQQFAELARVFATRKA